jgi:membrane protein implicated in regulation of membrane protease activity
VIVHHIFLFIPLLALVLFIFLPWPLALLLYLPIAITSLIAFWKAIQVLREPSVAGKSAMIGDQAVVVDVMRDELEVHYQGENWHAVATQPVNPGQKVIIEDVDGLTLLVAPLAVPQNVDAPGTNVPYEG